MSQNTETFIRLTSERSASNLASIQLLFDNQLFGQAIAVLRNELDSLTRVCYLLATPDLAERQKLIDDKVDGKKWNIGDNALVTRASHYNSWATDVYFFGNQFTHLTDYHDYKANDPLATLDADRKANLRTYLASYHQFPSTTPITFETVIPYVPRVAAKVATNLSGYLGGLERAESH